MVISIAYQSAGQSLAKLEVAYRSHKIHAADPTTPPACYAPARGSKLQPRLIRQKNNQLTRPRMGGLRRAPTAYSTSEIYAKFSGNIKIK